MNNIENNCNSESCRESKKLLAVGLARDSTFGQSDKGTPISLQERNIAACAEREGYKLTRQISVTWTAADFMNCPEILELCRMIDNREFNALIVDEEDRLPNDDEGMGRLNFIHFCHRNGVKIIAANGTPISEGDRWLSDEARNAEYKEWQRRRAQNGAKKGIAERVRQGKPAHTHAPYGFDCDYTSGVWKLVPNAKWPIIKKIIEMVLANKQIATIIEKLKKDTIPSPAGLEKWPRFTIREMVNNPVYYGRYHALRTEVVMPSKRIRGARQQFGLTSKKRIEGKWLENVVVEQCFPWETLELVKAQLQRNKHQSRRNAKRDYFLRGRVFCDDHLNNRGYPTPMYGMTRKSRGKEYSYYVCPTCGCSHARRDGQNGLDCLVQWGLKVLLRTATKENNFFADFNDSVNNEADIRAEIEALNKRRERIINALSALLVEYHSSDFHGTTDAYEKAKTVFNTRLASIDDQISAANDKLAASENVERIRASWQKLAEHYEERIDTMTNSEILEFLSFLRLEVHLTESIDRACSDDESLPLIMDGYNKYVNMKIGIPIDDTCLPEDNLKAREVVSIVTRRPGLISP